MRPWTFSEWLRLTLLGAKIRDQIDPELGQLVQRLADGDDSTLPLLHDRLNVVGDFAGADRLRGIVEAAQ